MQLRVRSLVKGFTTYVPILRRLACRSSGGTVSARYCYSVWLRHLVKVHEIGLGNGINRVAELGPGDSFGIGLAAMLSGANEYYAFDAKKHAQPALSLKVFEELVELFTRREPIPDEAEFPEVAPRIAQYDFPAAILTNELLDRSLRPARLDAIRRALQGLPADSNVRIAYVAPWDESSLLEPGVIDMAFSQAVLEHVDHVAATYCASI